MADYWNVTVFAHCAKDDLPTAPNDEIGDRVHYAEPTEWQDRPATFFEFVDARYGMADPAVEGLIDWLIGHNVEVTAHDAGGQYSGECSPFVVFYRRMTQFRAIERPTDVDGHIVLTPQKLDQLRGSDPAETLTAIETWFTEPALYWDAVLADIKRVGESHD